MRDRDAALIACTLREPHPRERQLPKIAAANRSLAHQVKPFGKQNLKAIYDDRAVGMTHPPLPSLVPWQIISRELISTPA
jgi:hypothetical protein